MDMTVNQEEQGSSQPTNSGSTGLEAREARRSLEALQGDLDALNPAELVTARIDVQRAAALAYSVARRDLVPARRAVFERLALGDFYEVGVLDKLPDLAQAAWYARLQQQMGLAEASAASVPDGVVQLAYEVRGRMQQVLEYWVGDDPKLAVRLKYLREGTGYQDLANDLQALADLYQRDEVRAVIEADRKRYRAADVDEAKRLRDAIFSGFGMGEEGAAERWTGLFQRAATLLLRSYDEHRIAGQFAFRRHEDVTKTYPSLFAAVRSAPSKRTPAADPAEGEGAEEVPVAGI